MKLRCLKVVIHSGEKLSTSEFVVVVVAAVVVAVVAVSSFVFVTVVFIDYCHKFLIIQPVYTVSLAGLTGCKRTKPVWRRDDRNTVTYHLTRSVKIK